MDLVALNSRHEETDRFTRFVYTRVLSWFHRMVGVNDTVRYALLILPYPVIEPCPDSN